MPVNFDMLNLHKQQSISHIAQSPRLALQKEMITAWALIRPNCCRIPLAEQSRYLCGDSRAYYYQAAVAAEVPLYAHL